MIFNMQMEVEGFNPDLIKDSPGGKRLRYKIRVQADVMEKLDYFKNNTQYQNAKTPEEKMMATNDVFIKWAESPNAKIFAECFDEIIKPETNLTEKDYELVVGEVISLMNERFKKEATS